MTAVMRNIQFHGTTMGSRKEFEAMIQYVNDNKIRPVIAQVVHGINNLQAIDGLFQTMQKGEQFGKLVVKISEDGPARAEKL